LFRVSQENVGTLRDLTAGFLDAKAHDVYAYYCVNLKISPFLSRVLENSVGAEMTDYLTEVLFTNLIVMLDDIGGS
jgi:hypothetical protein